MHILCNMLKPYPDTSETEQTGITAAGANFSSRLQPAHTCNDHAPLDMKHTLCYVLSGPSMQWHVTAWLDA
eukprot:jgi/Chrzof1/6613/Cz19g02200.t1